MNQPGKSIGSLWSTSFVLDIVASLCLSCSPVLFASMAISRLTGPFMWMQFVARSRMDASRAFEEFLRCLCPCVVGHASVICITAWTFWTSSEEQTEYSIKTVSVWTPGTSLGVPVLHGCVSRLKMSLLEFEFAEHECLYVFTWSCQYVCMCIKISCS